MSIRAVRNNNPGNIRIGAKWQGLMSRTLMNPEQAAETQFCVFMSAVFGFRAMATIFHTYADKDGVKTLRQAIGRWAPPSENNTAAYVKMVSDYTGIAPDAPFPFRDIGHLGALVKAVSIQECGGWFFQQGDLAQGVAIAG